MKKLLTEKFTFFVIAIFIFAILFSFGCDDIGSHFDEDLNDVVHQYKEVYAWAAPSMWGPWKNIRSHYGEEYINIDYEPIGDTIVYAEVKYFDKSNNEVVKPFFGSISFKTGDSIANIYVRFKGIPMGSAVRIFVN